MSESHALAIENHRENEPAETSDQLLIANQVDIISSIPATRESDENGIAETDSEYDEWTTEVPATDSVRQFLTEIGRVPLLKAEEEVELAKRIEAGLFAQELLDDSELFVASETVKQQAKAGRREEEIRNDLLLLEADGKQAKNQFIEANLRLTVSLAKRYQRMAMNLHLLDLIQIGNEGLIRAVEKFDYTKGYKFSTYATWWIRQALQRGIADQDKTIRVPVHMVEQINKALRVQRQLIQDLGREPSMEEIGAELGITSEKAEEVLGYGREPASLQTPIGEGGDGQLGDIIEDSDAPVAHDAAAFVALQDKLKQVLNTLPYREEQVIRLRFGIDDGMARTLDEVGQVFGLTRERIRQIEAKAMFKLRHPSHKTWLKDFLD